MIEKRREKKEKEGQTKVIVIKDVEEGIFVNVFLGLGLVLADLGLEDGTKVGKVVKAIVKLVTKAIVATELQLRKVDRANVEFIPVIDRRERGDLLGEFLREVEVLGSSLALGATNRTKVDIREGVVPVVTKAIIVLDFLGRNNGLGGRGGGLW